MNKDQDAGGLLSVPLCCSDAEGAQALGAQQECGSQPFTTKVPAAIQGASLLSPLSSSGHLREAGTEKMMNAVHHLITVKYCCPAYRAGGLSFTDSSMNDLCQSQASLSFTQTTRKLRSL